MFLKLVLHLGNDELVCVPWRFGRPLSERRFATSEHGYAQFTEWLRDWQNVPTRLVVDLIEEDFRVETLPHLRGRDRRVVIERRLAQLYRATPFRLAVMQGREAGGRRDDVVLCTAITQTDSLVACLDALARWRIPMLGVYPAALLGEQLLRRLRVDAEQLVLVTLLPRDALRMSFFQRGRLRFSRISQPAPDATGSIAAGLREETRRTLQYVGAQSWFVRNVPVGTLLIAEAADADRLAAVWQDTESPLQVISPLAVARRLGTRVQPSAANATGLLLHLLMLHPPREQLAPRERTRDGWLWRLRSLIFAASSAVALGAAVLAGLDVVTALDVRESSARLTSELAIRRDEIAQAQARMPVSSLSPDRMSALVRFDRNEVEGAPQFTPLLQGISRALDGAPDLRLRRVVWTTSTARPAPAAKGVMPVSGSSNGPRTDNQVLTGLIRRHWYQEARIEGEIAESSRDPALADQAVERLAAALRGPGLDVEVARPPYDLDPAHGLGSNAIELTGRSPQFVLRVSGEAAKP